MKEKETSPAVASERPRVLLVNARPHKSGCTNRALEEVAAELERQGVDTPVFWVGNKPVGGCIGCKLGVGGNTPGIIKYPFWQMCARNPHATCARASLTRAAARQCRERYAHLARRSGCRG